MKLNGGQFNVCIRDVREEATRATWSEYTVCPHHVHSLDELSTNGFYNLSVNVLDLISVKTFPRDVRGLKKLSVTGLKILSLNILPRDFM